MGARFYDPALGRWLSADTLVPEPSEPQSFNRYSWVLNNPLNYIDPSGHQKTRDEWEKDYCAAHGGPQKCNPTDQDWWDYLFSTQINNFAGWIATYTLRQLLYSADTHFETDGTTSWTMQEVNTIGGGIEALSNAMGGMDTYLQAVGTLVFSRIGRIRRDPGGFVPMGYGNGTIYVYDRPQGQSITSRQVVHELAHKWDENVSLSRAFISVRNIQEPPSPYADTHYVEDWAESVSFYVTGVPLPSGWILSLSRQLIVSYALSNPVSPDWNRIKVLQNLR